jgi:hypothetical protein
MSEYDIVEINRDVSRIRIRPCPRCKDATHELGFSVFSCDSYGDPAWLQIKCTGCGYVGPEEMWPAEVVEAWNKLVISYVHTDPSQFVTESTEC